MRLTREDIVKVYDELDRRIESDIKDEYITTSEDIRNEYQSRLQGVYGTIMVLVENDNWQDITRWKNEIEVERYDWKQMWLEAVTAERY